MIKVEEQLRKEARSRKVLTTYIMDMNVDHESNTSNSVRSRRDPESVHHGSALQFHVKVLL